MMCACTECRFVMDEFDAGFDKGAYVSFCPYCGSSCDLVWEDEMTGQEWNELTEDWEMI